MFEFDEKRCDGIKAIADYFFNLAVMNSIVYRQADVSDLALLVRSRVDFMNSFWGDTYSHKEPELAAHLAAYFMKHLVSGDYVSFLAFCGEEFAGVGGMHIREMPGGYRNMTGRVGYIMNMFTIPAYRRKGICKAILDQLIATGKQAGIHLFELHATADGEKVYPQTGFKLHNEPTYRLFIENQ